MEVHLQGNQIHSTEKTLVNDVINPLNAKDLYIRPEIRESDSEDIYIHPPWSFVLFSPVICVVV